jgi:3-oxoacyl-[acyl-carrier-protein] synthase II
MIPQREVVITGIGLVSPLGNTREITWQKILEGVSAAKRIRQFDASSWPTRIACEVESIEVSLEALRGDLRSFANRPTEFGVQAAYEAIIDSGFLGSVDLKKFGVSIGASIGAISPSQLAHLLVGMPISEGLPHLSQTVMNQATDRFLTMRNHPGTLGALLASQWHAQGPLTTIHTACASSGQSLGQAYLQIKRGDCDLVLAGGADSLAGELLLAGFCLLGTLSTRNDDPEKASRPFDRERDGFVASEGAAMLILEEKTHALKRGAKIYAQFSGYGETASAYRITDLPEDGRGIVEAMEHALTDGKLQHQDIHYINAHGTSTQLNDRVEAQGIRRVFGTRGFYPAISSTKSEIGHLISAAGAMEAAFTALAIRDQIAPPTINLKDTDCGDDLNFIGERSIKIKIDAALSNSIGFGGSNSVIALSKFQG